MKLLEINERILARRFPEVLRRLSGEFEKESPWQLTAQEINVLSPRIGEGNTYPYGVNNGTKVVERWLRALPCRDRSLLALSGFGSGFHVERLLDHLGPDSCVFVGERYPALLKEVLSKRDCSRLLADPRILLATGPLDGAFFEPLEAVQFVQVDDAQPLIYAPLFSSDEQYYASFFTEFARHYDLWRRLYRSQVRDAELQQSNSLRNLPVLLTAPDIGETAAAFTTLPVVLVGAGPSLDDAVEFLRSARECAIIVCVNSAYRKLRNSGILPHAVVAADPRPDTLKGFGKYGSDDAFLICPFFVYPEVAQRFRSQVITWTGMNSLVRFIRVGLGLPPGTPVLEQGTASVSIVDIARIWGCPKICLVGQDMALTEEGRTHTRDSFYADEQRLNASINECRRLPGNRGGPVYVEERLFVYLKTFEKLVVDNAHIDFLNTAARGARIENVPYGTFDEALEWLGHQSSRDFSATLQKYFAGGAPPASLEEGVAERIGSLERFSGRVFRTALKGAVCCDLLLNSKQKSSSRQKRRQAEIDELADCLNRLLDLNPKEYEVLFDGRTKLELVKYLENLRDLPDESDPKYGTAKNRIYFWAVCQGAQNFRAHLRQTMRAA